VTAATIAMPAAAFRSWATTTFTGTEVTGSVHQTGGDRRVEQLGIECLRQLLSLRASPNSEMNQATARWLSFGVSIE